MKQLHNGYKPGLAIIQVGERQDSNVYVRQKMKAAEDIGIDAKRYHLPKTSNQIEVGTYSVSKTFHYCLQSFFLGWFC